MSLILSLTKTRYLLYVEDDWWAVHDKPISPQASGDGNFLRRALEVLRNSAEGVAQASLEILKLYSTQSSSCKRVYRGEEAVHFLWRRLTLLCKQVFLVELFCLKCHLFVTLSPVRSMFLPCHHRRDGGLNQ